MSDSTMGVESTVGVRKLGVVWVHHHRIVHRLVHRTTRTSEHTVVLLGVLLGVHVWVVWRRWKTMAMLLLSVVSIGRHDVRILLVLLVSLFIRVATMWMTRVGRGRVRTDLLVSIVTNIGEGRSSGHGDWCTTMVLLLLGITVGSRSRTIELLQ